MATDWAADVKKYDAKADDTAIAGIVRYCGIALRNRDSALVSFSDKAETDRVRTNFLKKKLGLTQADSVLNAAIAKVGEQMKADRTKNRVTVYYLLANEFKALGQFVKAAPAAKKAPAATAAPAKVAARSAASPAVKAASVVAVAAGAAAAKAKPAMATPAKKAPAAKPAAAPAKQAAAPVKIAAPAKKAAAPAKATTAKATTAKAAAPAANATQGLLDKAATNASDAAKAAPKAAVAAAAGTAAAIGAGATGAVSLAKDTATKAADTSSSAANAATGKASAMPPGASKPAASTATDDDGSEMNWLWWVIGLAVFAFVAWFVFGRGPAADDANVTEAAASAAASDVGTDLAAAVPEGNAVIPAGAGVTSEMRDGKPVVKVYFDSGMTSVTPDFAKTAGGLKSWLDTHSGATLAVSGYSDPSGNAAANAELAKQRAQAVQSALVAADIPATSAALVKPDVVADAAVAKEAARRVEVVVK